MARLYIADYMGYDTITKAEYATWQIATDVAFLNIIAETTKDPVNVLTWYGAILNNMDYLLNREGISNLYGRVKLYTDNTESPWYYLKPDQSEHFRLYYAGNLLKEKIVNRDGDLIIEQDFTTEDNPIDLWFYKNVYTDDFNSGYINTMDWIIEQYSLNGVLYNNKFIDATDTGFIRIGCKLDPDGLMGTDIRYRHSIDFNNGTYIETRINYLSQDDADLSVILTGNILKIILADYNPKTGKYIADVMVNGESKLSIELDITGMHIFGCLLEDNTIKIYMDHKLIGSADDIPVDKMILKFVAKPNTDLTTDTYMDIDYLTVYLKDPNCNIPDEAKLDPLELY